MDWEGLSLSKQALRGFHHGIARGQFLSLLLAFAEQYLHSDIAAICLGKHALHLYVQLPQEGTVFTQLNKVELYLISTNNLRYSASITLHCILPTLLCAYPSIG